MFICRVESFYRNYLFQSKHEGLKHPCDSCDFQGSSAVSLNRHVEAFHSGLQFKCRECNYVTNTLQSLRIHRKKVVVFDVS